jgi:AcrR family transcriptional regulator
MKKRVRLCREESREQTRQRLLDAAQSVIAKKGLAGTSVEDIAAAAGYTRGAFYSNFRSKGDLFIELLRRDHRQAHDAMSEILGADLQVEQLEQRVRQMYGQLYRSNEGFMNWTEARMLAARDAKFRAKLNALMLEKRDFIAAFIVHFYARVGVSPPSPPAELAMGLMSLVEGVKLFRLSSPQDMTVEAAESILTLFIDSLMRLARLRASDQRQS